MKFILESQFINNHKDTLHCSEPFEIIDRKEMNAQPITAAHSACRM